MEEGGGRWLAGIVPPLAAAGEHRPAHGPADVGAPLQPADALAGEHRPFPSRGSVATSRASRISDNFPLTRCTGWSTA